MAPDPIHELQAFLEELESYAPTRNVAEPAQITYRGLRATHAFGTLIGLSFPTLSHSMPFESSSLAILCFILAF